MARHLAAALTLIALASCERPAENPLPPAQVVRAIEAKLHDQSCIGDLQKWERRYRYDRDAVTRQGEGGALRLDRIEVRLRKAGPDGIKAGVRVEPPLPAGWAEIDDTPTDFFVGEYEPQSGTLVKKWCGPNFPAQRAPVGANHAASPEAAR